MVASKEHIVSDADLENFSESKRDRIKADRDNPDLCLESLFEKHGAEIRAIQLGCKYELESAAPVANILYDDLFILRYFLSKKTVESSIKYVRDCIRWRTENKKWLEEVVRGVPQPGDEVILKNISIGFHKPNVLGEPIFILRAGTLNAKEIFKSTSTDIFTTWLNAKKEVDLQNCDALTRKFGRLTKSNIVFDLTDFGMSNVNTKVYTCLSASSAHSEKYYPSLLNCSITINAPKMFSVVHKMVIPLLSKSTQEKQKLCGGQPSADLVSAPSSSSDNSSSYISNMVFGVTRTKSKKSPKRSTISSCPYASIYCSPENLPDFLGGYDEFHPMTPGQMQ